MALKAPANHELQLYSAGWIASPGMLLSGLLLSPVSTENMKIGVIICTKKSIQKIYFMKKFHKKGGGSTCSHTSVFFLKKTSKKAVNK